MRKFENNTTSPASTRGGRKEKNDLIFIAVLRFLAGIAALCLILFRSEGDLVTVTVDGKLFGEYSLSEDRTVEIKQGDGYNILVIEDGYARVENASCPDGICSSHKPVKHDGESIICLPNKVVIEVHSSSDEQPDIIA